MYNISTNKKGGIFMEKHILYELSEILLLDDDKKYQKYVETFLDENSSEKDKEKSKGIIIRIILKAFNSNEKIKENLSSEDEQLINGFIQDAILTPDISDNDFYRLVYIIAEKSRLALATRHLNFILDSLKNAAKELSSSTVKNILSDVDHDSEFNVKKARIISAIQELHLEIKTKIIQKVGKKNANSELKSAIDSVNNKMQNCILLMESGKKDYKFILNEINDFLTEDFNLLQNCTTYSESKDSEKKESSCKSTKLANRQPNFALIRTPKSGKSDRPIHSKKKIILIGLAITIGLGSAFLLGRYSKNNTNSDKNISYQDDIDQNQNNDLMNDEEKDSVVSAEKIDELSTQIYENWKTLGCEYSKEDIVELIKLLNGMESSISIETADDMLIDVLNRATVPTVNSIITGTKEESNKVQIADLLLENKTGITAVSDMESYLNGAIENPFDINEYANGAIEDEVRLLVNDETVEGLDLTSATNTDPALRLVWSRLAINANAIFGTLGEDYSYSDGNDTYYLKEINDCNILEEVAKDAMKDMGYTAKTLNYNE